MHRSLHIALTVAITLSSFYCEVRSEEKAGVLINDDYSSTHHETRKALRGDWTIANGEASVAQDDELYKKYANHGPIMVYEVPHQNAFAVVEVKPSRCRTVVFTMDAVDGGHAFRILMRCDGEHDGKGEPAGVICTYAAKVGNEKAERIKLQSDIAKLKSGDWNRIEVKVVGKKALVKINGEAYEVEHDRIAQSKKIAKIGFSYGKMSLSNFELNAL